MGVQASFLNLPQSYTWAWKNEQKHEYFQTGMSENRTIYISMMKNWVSHLLFLRKTGLIIYLAALKKSQGDNLIFSACVGSDPASTVHQKKIFRNFKHPKKIFKILATQKNIPILYLDLKKDPKLHRSDPQTSPILCDDPQKISTKSSYPPKIFIFLKTSKNIEIQNFEPKNF